MKALSLILIAGWGYTGRAMLRLHEALDAPAVQVVTTGDLWKSGAVKSLRRSPDLSRYAAGLCNCLANRQPSDGRADVVGWSMGGIVALETALKYPGLIRRLVIIGGTARFCAGEDDPPGVSAAVVRAMIFGLKRTPETVLSAFYERVHAPREVNADGIAARLADMAALDREELIQGLLYLQHTDLREGLDKLPVPTLIAHGRNDLIVPWRAGEWLSDRIARSKWRCYGGQGHALPIRAPELLAADIRAFLGGAG